MIVGFTGTRRGLTPLQHAALDRLVRSLEGVAGGRHGDAVGADEQFARIFRDAHPTLPLTAHPCNLRGQRSVLGLYTAALTPAHPLDRNRAIVAGCDLLVACPAGLEEEQRSGTWATVRYARSRNKPVRYVWPDGLVTETPRGGEA